MTLDAKRSRRNGIWRATDDDDRIHLGRLNVNAVFSNSLLLPAFVLAVVAFVVPRVVARILPEGVKPLLVNAFLSTALLFTLSAILFFCLYLWQGLSVAELMLPGLAANVVFFGQLGLVSAIIWAPIMLLSVAALPRRWVKETW